MPDDECSLLRLRTFSAFEPVGMIGVEWVVVCLDEGRKKMYRWEVSDSIPRHFELPELQREEGSHSGSFSKMFAVSKNNCVCATKLDFVIRRLRNVALLKGVIDNELRKDKRVSTRYKNQ